ncbi:MAG: DNA-binding transcriptional regulator [Kiritimatiellia bacterium]
MKPGRDKLQGIFNYVHLYGPWHLDMIQSRASEHTIRMSRNWNEYDGIIADQIAFDLIPVIRNTRRPIVLIATPPPDIAASPLFSRIPCIAEDSTGIGAIAADYFIKRGLKHIAYVGDPLMRTWSNQRGDAFRKRGQQAGCSCAIYAPPRPGSDWKRERRDLSHWLLSLPKPTAILAAMDTRAHQVLDACEEAGLRIPHEIAVMGIDNDELICNGSIPTLSSIQRDTLSCGFQAAGILDAMMRRRPPQDLRSYFGVDRIVTRESSRINAPLPDIIAARAAEFIRINAGESFNVSAIARHLNVSRRLLEIRFRVAYGMSLLEAIRNARLDRVSRLLSQTDLPLSDICAQCSYQTDIHLRRLFKRRFGMTMRTYRKQNWHQAAPLKTTLEKNHPGTPEAACQNHNNSPRGKLKNV